MTFLPTGFAGPFTARSLLVTDAAGRDQILTVVKASWTVPLDGAPQLDHAEVRNLPALHEERAGSSIRLPSDLAPTKPGTEVILVGHARFPAAYPDARWVDVTLSVENGRTILRKQLRVFGPRRWQTVGGTPAPSAPERFEDTPLRWEWAFGGADVSGCDARNPIGRGFGTPREGDACHRIELADPPTGGAHPVPVGFAPLAPQWEPRRSRAGSATNDDLAPHPPADRDPRHYCCAPDDQWLAEPLVGGETIVVTGVHPDAAWAFGLPAVQPEVAVSIRGRTEMTTPHLDTVLLDADAEQVVLTWRTLRAAPRSLAEVDGISVRPRVESSAECVPSSVPRASASPARFDQMGSQAAPTPKT